MTELELIWKKQYLIGIEDIDFQHHFFLNLIKRLQDEIKNPHSQQHLVSLLDEIRAYARFHFISEENMMFEADYPSLEIHREHHRELLNQLSTKSTLLEVDPSTKHFDEVIQFLLNWFINHTASEDKLFADFLHNNNIDSAPGAVFKS